MAVLVFPHFQAQSFIRKDRRHIFKILSVHPLHRINSIYLCQIQKCTEFFLLCLDSGISFQNTAAPEGPVILPVIGALPLPNRLKPAKLKASESTVVPPTLPTFRHTRTPMPRFLI